MANQDLMSLLACPISGGKAPVRQEDQTLICPCGVKYAIVDDIPNMLIEEAELPPGCATPSDVKCPHHASVSAASASSQQKQS